MIGVIKNIENSCQKFLGTLNLFIMRINLCQSMNKMNLAKSLSLTKVQSELDLKLIRNKNSAYTTRMNASQEVMELPLTKEQIISTKHSLKSKVISLEKNNGFNYWWTGQQQLR